MATERSAWVLFLCLWVAACSAESGGSAGSHAAPSDNSGSPSAPAGGGISTGVGGSSNTGSPVSLPPEKELDQVFRAPVATGRALWSANPDSGRVALIDAQTLKVRMASAGFGPTYLAAVPSAKGTASAIVLNVGSHDASWLTATDEQSDVTVVASIATHTGANSWAVSGDGHFAIAWTDVTQIEGPAPDPSDGFSELTVIDLSATPPVGTRLSVGFRPSQVTFDARARRAFAVVDEGITVLDLTAEPAVSALVSVGAGGQATRDVNIARDGSFAVVRTDGSADIGIFDLTASATEPLTITLDSEVTDLDLTADGKTATAVLGNATPPKVTSFAVPVPETAVSDFQTTAVPGELVRSVTLTPDQQVALLYADAVPNSHLTLLDDAVEGSATFRTLDLRGAIQRVYVAPDSQTAIALQLPPPGSTKKGLFSILSTEMARPANIVATDAAPADVAFSDAAGGKALVTVHDATSTVRGVYIVGLANLDQTFVPLASEPLPGAAGIVPSLNVGFVAERHPEGRITFIDLDSGVARTLTGFEIAARVVQ